jgi:ParB family transcriptional regulator, chromosome partitioning protein
MARKVESTGKPKKAPGKRAARPRRGKKPVTIQGLSAAEVASGSAPEDVESLARMVRESGGGVVGSYRDPVGGHWLIIASLPIERVEPTPFQRDISAAHVERLTDVIGRMGRFLDPIIAVANPQGSFWTPNGHHRLAAMRALGARSILAVLVPEASVAYQILAMNTEKGHNLREKSLEVIRMARSLSGLEARAEKDYALEFEEPDFLTLGLAYEKRGRLSGGAYHPVLRRVETFLDAPLAQALEVRSRRADALLALDDAVALAVAALKERGLTSPYLKAFVVARINPLRFRRVAARPGTETDAARPTSATEADDVLAAMMSAVRKLDVEKINVGDLAAAPPVGGEE